MFLTFPEVILISNLKKRQPEDAVVYIQHLPYGLRHLWPNFWPGYALTEQDIKEMRLVRYGTIYTDKTNKENWCIVPDVWSEADAQIAKMRL